MFQNWISVKKYYFKLSSKIWVQDWSISFIHNYFLCKIGSKGENIYSLYNNILKRSHVTLTIDLKSLYTLSLCNQCEWSINQVLGPSREGRIYGPDRYLIQYVCYDFNLWRRNRCTDLSLKDTRKAWSCLSLLFQGINLHTLSQQKNFY